jgi:hypothetical protein
MNIKNLLNNSAMHLRGLVGRLEVQLKATHDPSDKDDLREWIDDCRGQIGALNAVASAYGPIIQSAIDTGIRGLTHRILVQAVHPETGAWADVSVHEFTVDVPAAHEGLESHG